MEGRLLHNAEIWGQFDARIEPGKHLLILNVNINPHKLPFREYAFKYTGYHISDYAEMWMLKHTHLDERDTFELFKSVNPCIFCCSTLCCILSDLCTCKEKSDNHPVFLLSVIFQLRTYSQSAAEASETLCYEKWSSTSFFYTTLCDTRRLESEALWRKHSCSGHLCCSCNIHWNHTTLTVG